jgi:Mlc titration factor MtfA (ptsG expression regulator)
LTGQDDIVDRAERMTTDSAKGPGDATCHRGADVRSGWRRQQRAPGLPETWHDVADRSVAHWAVLDTDERARLGALMDEMFRRKRWEAARGFELTDEMRIVIAAEACLLVLGLDIRCFRDVTSIIVHPTTVTVRGERAGPARGVVTDSPLPILGQAHARRGPVIIAWDAARADARHGGTGHNVVLHEFTHKLDMLDDLIDGTPPLPDQSARQRWIDVCTAEYELLRAGHGDGLLSDYAALNPGEFFAVATEVFFDLPGDMRQQKPALYAVLRDFYRQDPARRTPG